MRKKIFVLLTAIIILLVCIIIGLSYEFWERKDWIAPTENKQNTLIEEPVHSIETEKTEFFALDTEYEKRFNEVYSNIEKCQVNDTYAAKWDEIASEYYNKLIGIANDYFKSTLIVSQAEWEKYAETSKEMHLEYLQAVYEASPTVPLANSYYNYNLHRERAIELYEMYTELKPIYDIGAEQSGTNGTQGDRTQGDGSSVSDNSQNN